MPQTDLFNLFRWLLSLVAGVYATVVTIQSTREAWLALRGKDRYVSMLRRYLVVHGLRLRVRAFWGDVLICLLLCVVFVLVWRSHGYIYQIGDALRDAYR
jgi:hypothetical protein